MSAGCELCDLHRTTHWYEEHTEPFRFVILDCDSCDVPMAVIGEHRAVASDEERRVLREALDRVAAGKFAADWFFDDHMRQIPDHYHMHVRPLPPGFRRPENKRPGGTG